MHNHHLGYLIVLLLGGLFLFCNINTTNASAIGGIPSKVPAALKGKYWQIKRKHHKTIYFYIYDDDYIIKHTSSGTARIIGNVYSKPRGYYVTTGLNILGNTNKTFWMFIKPNKKFNKLKIGYTEWGFNSWPNHSPEYYAKYTATRVSKVTAILH